jgi:hypothetical protein
MLSAGNGSITSFGLLINGAFLSFASATAGQSGTPVGTWRCMGYSSGAGITTASSVTLWLRAF